MKMRIPIIISITPFVTMLMLFSPGCSSPTSAGTGETSEGRPDQESWEVTISMTDAGIQRAIVQAGHLEKFNDRLYILLDQKVEVDFFDLEEKHTSRLTSQLAEVDEKSDFMRAIQNVVVKSDSGVTLFTDTLSWDHAQGTIYTDDSVMITTEKQDTLYGIGFESDVQMEHWKILHPSGVTNRGDDEK